MFAVLLISLVSGFDLFLCPLSVEEVYARPAWVSTVFGVPERSIPSCCLQLDRAHSIFVSIAVSWSLYPHCRAQAYWVTFFSASSSSLEAQQRPRLPAQFAPGLPLPVPVEVKTPLLWLSSSASAKRQIHRRVRRTLFNTQLSASVVQLSFPESPTPKPPRIPQGILRPAQCHNSVKSHSHFFVFFPVVVPFARAFTPPAAVAFAPL